VTKLTLQKSFSQEQWVFFNIKYADSSRYIRLLSL